MMSGAAPRGGMKSSMGTRPWARRPLRLQHQRSFAIAARRFARRLRRDESAAVLRTPKKGRKAGVGVEAWEAAQVDRAAALNERGRLQIRQKRIVLDPATHRPARLAWTLRV